MMHDLAFCGHHLVPSIGTDPSEILEIKTEYIVGRRFTNTRGEIITIGVSREVQDLIGLPFHVYEEQEASILCLKTDLSLKEGKLKMLKSANFFTRLKWLFSGVS
jgi:hypothetical protein